MSIVDLTFDSSDDESAVTRKSVITPLSDINGNSSPHGRATSMLYQSSLPIPPPKPKAKSLARGTTGFTILDRLSKPIQFASSVPKQEGEYNKKEDSEESDSDSANLVTPSSFFFPTFNQKPPPPPSVKREHVEIPTPVPKRSNVITPPTLSATARKGRGKKMPDIIASLTNSPLAGSKGVQQKSNQVSKPNRVSPMQEELLNFLVKSSQIQNSDELNTKLPMNHSKFQVMTGNSPGKVSTNVSAKSSTRGKSAKVTPPKRVTRSLVHSKPPVKATMSKVQSTSAPPSISISTPAPTPTPSITPTPTPAPTPTPTPSITPTPPNNLLLAVERMLQVADNQPSGNESRDFLELTNYCRFLQYVIKNKPETPLLSLYKRFIKTKRYISVEPENACETTTVIESPVSTPVKPKTKPKRPKRTLGTPVSSLQSYMQTPLKASDTYLLEQSIVSITDPREESVLHTFCNCLHTEFDFRSLNHYLLRNYCFKENWICEFLNKNIVDNQSVAVHLQHYLFWMKRRFCIHLPFYYPFIEEVLGLLNDLIEGNEVKRRGRKPKVDQMQIQREAEEKQRKRKNHVISTISFLLLLSLILLDEVRNNDCYIENLLDLEDFVKNCIFAVWDKSTLLAQYPQYATFTKALMVRVLSLMGAHHPNEDVRSNFIHFLVVNGSNDMLKDMILLSSEEQWKVDLLAELSTSKRTRFTTLLKTPSIPLIAKQYGFVIQSKVPKSAQLILNLTEKIKNKASKN